MDISVVEPLGANQLVHGKVNGESFIVVTPEVTLDIDVPLSLFVDPNEMHLFDESGLRIERSIVDHEQAIA